MEPRPANSLCTAQRMSEDRRAWCYDSKSGHVANLVHFMVQWRKSATGQGPDSKSTSLVLFIDEFKGHFNCCILPAGKNAHTHTHKQGLDMVGLDVVGALWGVEEHKKGRRRLVLIKCEGEGMEKRNKRRRRMRERGDGLFMRLNLEMRTF